MPSSKLKIILATVFVVYASIIHAQSKSSLSGKDFTKDFAIKDTMFKTPYVDIDEWRDVPVRHRYVHGGFKGNLQTRM